MLDIVLHNPWVRAGGFMLLLLVVALLVYLLSPVLVSLLFAFLVAYIFDPLMDFFERRRVPRMVAVVGLVVVLLLLVLAFPLMVLPGIFEQAARLVEAASAASDEPWLAKLVQPPLRALVELLDWAPAGDSDYQPLAVLAYRGGELIKENAAEFLRIHAREVAVAGKESVVSVAAFFAFLGNGVLGTVLFLGNLALFAFVTIYLLKDYDAIITGIDDLIPPRYRPKVRDIMGRIDAQLQAFLRGQFTVCCCLGTMYGLGMIICGVPFAVPLALFGAVASFVPYVGPALTIGPALLLTLLQYGLSWRLAGVVLTFAAAQTLEGNVLTPKIVGSQVGLNPVWVILAILVFSSAFGFVGLLLAVPMAAALKVLVIEAVAYYKASPLFEGPAAGGPDA